MNAVPLIIDTEKIIYQKGYLLLDYGACIFVMQAPFYWREFNGESNFGGSWSCFRDLQSINRTK